MVGPRLLSSSINSQTRRRNPKSSPDNASLGESADALRHWEDFPRQTLKQAERYADYPRMPGPWFSLSRTKEVLRYARKHHVGNEAGVASLEFGAAFGKSCCINHGSNGTLKIFLFRYYLHHRAGKAWPQVTRIINRLFACGLIRRVPGAPHLIQFRFYNDKALKRQKMQEKKFRPAVTICKSKVTNSSIRSSTYGEVNSLLCEIDASAERAGSPVCSIPSWEVCFPFSFQKNPPNLLPASSDGIGPYIVPVAKQSQSAQAIVVPDALPEPSVLPPPSPNPEKDQRDADAFDAMLKAKLPKGMQILGFGRTIVSRRKDEPPVNNFVPSISEAEARGHRPANIQQSAELELIRKKAASHRRRPLRPVCQTTASFVEYAADVIGRGWSG